MSQGAVQPAVAAPVESVELRGDVPVRPFLTVRIAIAATLCRKFELHAVRRLDKVQVGLCDVQIKEIL